MPVRSSVVEEELNAVEQIKLNLQWVFSGAFYFTRQKFNKIITAESSSGPLLL